MNITNPWLTPYQRSYHQIKEKLISAITSITDSNGNQLISDVSEGNVLIIVISMFAAIAEVLHYYIDTKAREFFLSTARRYTSLQALGKLVGYYPHGATAAKVDLILTRTTYLNIQFTLSHGVEFNSNNTIWVLAKDLTIGSNVGTVRVPLIQHRPFDLDSLVGKPVNEDIDSITILSSSIPSGEYYEHGSLQLSINNETWTLVDTFAYSRSNDLHYMVELTEGGNILIRFGDGNFGKRPSAGTITQASCYLTKGSDGNVDSGSINTVPSELYYQGNNPWEGSNTSAATGGTDYENIESFRNHIQLQVRTQGVAITKRDYEDIALMVPGISKAKVEYLCGRRVNLYILPFSQSNDIDTVTALNQQVKDKLDPYLPISTELNVYSMGTSRIVLNVDVTGKPNYKKQDILSHIRTALYNNYNVSVSEIGGSVRISDLYALLDNIASVDYLRINKFYIRPWVIPINGGLGWTPTYFSLIKADQSVTYILTVLSSTEIEFISKDGKFRVTESRSGSSSITVDDTFHGVKFSMNISSSFNTTGMKAKVTISQINNDYVDTGYTVPVFSVNTDLTANITETI